MDLSKVLNVQENINFGIRGRVGHYKVVENKLFRSFCCDGRWEEESPSMVLGVILYEVPDGIIRLSPQMFIAAVDQGHAIAQGSSEGLSSPPTMSNVDAINILKNIETEEERFHKLLHMIFDICALSDFEIEGRIVLVDKRSGKVWR